MWGILKKVKARPLNGKVTDLLALLLNSSGFGFVGRKPIVTTFFILFECTIGDDVP